MAKRNSWEEKWKKVSDKPLGEGGQGVVYEVESRDVVNEIRSITHNVLGHTGGYTEEAFDDLRSLINTIVKMDSKKYRGALKTIKGKPYGNNLQKAKIRFKHEVKILKKYLHSNLIKILDTDYESWYVSKYYPNGTLTEANNNNMFKGDVYKAVMALRPLIEGVSVLHAGKEYHRDIKPDNIFLDEDNNLILGDFGIAYYEDNQPRVTVTQEQVGGECTPPWARDGRLDNVQPNFDVYSLGKVLWTMLTGNPVVSNEYYYEGEGSLISMFPLEKYMYLMHELLIKCVVHEKKRCKIHDAEKLLGEVDYIIQMIKNNSDRLCIVDEKGNEIERLCKVCGVGAYRLIADYTDPIAINRFGIKPSDHNQLMKALVCSKCGHVELFTCHNSNVPPLWFTKKEKQ